MKSLNVTISSPSLRQMKGIFRVGNNFIFLKGQEVFRVIGVINHLILYFAYKVHDNAR